jgi:hypothetical protein
VGDRTLHKTGAARKSRRKKNPVVEVLAEHDLIDGCSVTYQRELVKCGKPRCRKWHGPYWYAYWTRGIRTRSLYIGKERRPAREVRNELETRRVERVRSRLTGSELVQSLPPLRRKRATRA